MNQCRAKQLPPQCVLSRLVCTQCRDLLSCDPVRILANNDVLCGRCSRAHLASAMAVRSVAFEDVANYFIYPCRYDQCNRVFERHEIGFHELKCEFGMSGCCSCWRRCGLDNSPSSKPKGVYCIKADDKTHELVTCAHCFGYLSAAPIFIRTNGTYICYRCGPDLQTPPVLRDKPLEALLDCFVIKCSYRMNGCEERFKFGAEIIEHEANCNYNPQKQFQSAPMSQSGNGPESSKIKGVISTIASGHIYATITPNHFNQYQKYGQQLEDEKKRRSQMIPRLSTRQESNDPNTGIPPARSNMSSGSGHRRQGSHEDISARSSISIENHRWDYYNGNQTRPVADGPKQSDKEDDGNPRKYIHASKVSGIGVARNESILYNKVVKEMKFKQHKKMTPSPTSAE